MVQSAGEGMQMLGDAMMRFGGDMALWQRRRENEAYLTDLEVKVSKGATELLSKLHKASWTDLNTPDGQDLGAEQIKSWIQSHKDSSEMIGQNNPTLAHRYNQMIARAEMQAGHAYQSIKDDKFKDFDHGALNEFLKTQSDAYQYASNDDERMAIMTGSFNAINQRSGSTIKPNDAFVMKSQWAAQTHEAFAFAQLNKMPPELSLGSIEQADKFLDDITNPIKYPFLTQGVVNHIRENFKSKLFTHMEQVNRVKGNESNAALLETIKFMNKNPGVFKTPGELQSWIEAQGQVPGMEKMKSFDARDLLTAMSVSQQPPATDYQALIPVMAGSSSWSDKKRKVLELYRQGKIGGRDAESHIARIDSHIDAEKNRSASMQRDPVQDTMTHPYLHVFSVLASDTLDPGAKMAASAATISFFDLLRSGVPMDQAFIRSVKDNNLNVSPKALPQLPGKYQHEEPAYSQRLLLDDYTKGKITKPEFDKNMRKLNNIKDLTVFGRDLKRRAQESAVQKKKQPAAGKGPAADSITFNDLAGFMTEGLPRGEEIVY